MAGSNKKGSLRTRNSWSYATTTSLLSAFGGRDKAAAHRERITPSIRGKWLYAASLLIAALAMQGCAMTPAVTAPPSQATANSMDQAVELWLRDMGSTDGKTAVIGLPSYMLLADRKAADSAKLFKDAYRDLCASYGGRVESGYVILQGRRIDADQTCVRQGKALAAVHTNRHPPSLNAINANHGITATRIPIVNAPKYSSKARDEQAETKKYVERQKADFQKKLARYKEEAEEIFRHCNGSMKAPTNLDQEIRTRWAYHQAGGLGTGEQERSHLYLEALKYRGGGLSPSDTPFAVVRAGKQSCASFFKPTPASQNTNTAAFPAAPAPKDGYTTCRTKCFNGDCYRTYSDGRKVHFQAQQVWDALNNTWTWDSGGC